MTFLFTDIESSTRMMEGHPEAYRAALARHHAILREAVGRRARVRLRDPGGRDLRAFEHSTTAVEAALAAQLACTRRRGRRRGPSRCVSGCTPRGGAGSTTSAPLYRCGRLMALAHGGQVLLSEITADPEGAPSRRSGAAGAGRAPAA